MFGGHEMSSLTSDWPDDAEVLGVRFDPLWKVTTLLVESALFDEIPDGGIPPHWSPTFTVETTLASELINMIERGEAEMEKEATGS